MQATLGTINRGIARAHMQHLSQLVGTMGCPAEAVALPPFAPALAQPRVPAPAAASGHSGEGPSGEGPELHGLWWSCHMRTMQELLRAFMGC